MRYDLALPRQDFDKANRLVKAVLLQSGKAELKAPALLTSDKGLLHAEGKDYLDAHPESLGVCFGDADAFTFDVWITPNYTRTETDAYRDTVLHELSHGYLGLYKHNHRFQRFLGRTLYHYSSIVHPIDHERLITRLVRHEDYSPRYNGESYPKYLERLDNEIAAIQKIAVDELDSVNWIYERLTRKELNA